MNRDDVFLALKPLHELIDELLCKLTAAQTSPSKFHLAPLMFLLARRN